MRLAEKNRHLSNDRSGLDHIGDHRSVFHYFKLTSDLHIKPATGLALANDLTSNGETGFPSPRTMFKNRVHSQAARNQAGTPIGHKIYSPDSVEHLDVG
jgi:hypothetical protein